MNLLVLVHRIPYPPNKGDKIRSWNEVRHLSERHRVHLGCMVDQEEDWSHVEALRARVASLEAVPLMPRRARIASLAAIAGSKPLSVRYFASQRLERWVADTLRREAIDAVFVFSSQMAEYVMDVDLPRVMDFCDVDSEKWREYAARAPRLLRPIYGLEAQRLAAYERAILERFDASVLVTSRERALWQSLPAELLNRVHVIPNGVDLTYFAPGALRPTPPPDPHALVFTGAMDYYANVDAVTFFAHEVLPRVQQRIPQARFFIVGNRPTPAVTRLAQLPGVEVTGFVEDTRAYYARAAACVVPLRIARGIQNKVLEAMAMGRPVVVTTAAGASLGARAGREVVIADGAEDFAAQVVDLLRNPARAEAVGAAARRFVEREYVWERAMSRLESLLEDAVARHRGGKRAVPVAVEEPTPIAVGTSRG
jgi:sugar transferase (PEP-CTERM/EpsH1 system associated)